MPAKSTFKDQELIDQIYKTQGDIPACAKHFGKHVQTIYSRIQRTKNLELTKAYADTQSEKQDKANLLDKRFGLRLVISKGKVGKQGHQFWICICDCGDIKEIPGHYLLNGRSQKCLNCTLVKHGMNRTSEYYAWLNIKQRCFNPKAAEYRNYGARGITMWKGYINNFEAFLNEVGKRPSNDHSIDRIDNNKGYEPGNMRWSTAKEQTNNRRITFSLEGQKVSCIDLSNEIGIDRETIRRMINLECTREEIESYPSLGWRQRREFFKAKKELFKKRDSSIKKIINNS